MQRRILFFLEGKNRFDVSAFFGGGRKCAPLPGGREVNPLLLSRFKDLSFLPLQSPSSLLASSTAYFLSRLRGSAMRRDSMYAAARLNDRAKFDFPSPLTSSVACGVRS